MLTPETRDKILTEVERYPQRRTAVLPALKHAQAQIGWLPPEAIGEVADLVGVSHAAANELATFYSMLRTRPGGRTRVEVCLQLPCALAGAERLLGALAEGLGIRPGEATTDGAIELIGTPECFGACHRAPMCRVNDDYREHLTPEATCALIEELTADRRRTTDGRRPRARHSPSSLVGRPARAEGA
ncbi:MAG TPA: NADH-quinone oxidoreductase subunit NuoE [Chloroflexota bacterium]|nr:NADH-quinone oxidoreductase subunit NuoE [Chloroflexota bacterium]